MSFVLELGFAMFTCFRFTVFFWDDLIKQSLISCQRLPQWLHLRGKPLTCLASVLFELSDRSAMHNVSISTANLTSSFRDFGRDCLIRSRMSKSNSASTNWSFAIISVSSLGAVGYARRVKRGMLSTSSGKVSVAFCRFPSTLLGTTRFN